jgi:hypothetical protein
MTDLFGDTGIAMLPCDSYTDNQHANGQSGVATDRLDICKPESAYWAGAAQGVLNWRDTHWDRSDNNFAPSQRDVVAERCTEAARLQKIGLHVDDDDRGLVL